MFQLGTDLTAELDLSTGPNIQNSVYQDTQNRIKYHHQFVSSIRIQVSSSLPKFICCCHNVNADLWVCNIVCRPLAIFIFRIRYGLNFALPYDNMFYGWPRRGAASVNSLQEIGLYKVRTPKLFNVGAISCGNHELMVTTGPLRYLRISTCCLFSEVSTISCSRRNVGFSCSVMCI